MAFRARKVFGTFEKRAPDHEKTTENYRFLNTLDTKREKNRLVRRVVRIYLTVYLWKWYGILKLARVLINYTGAVDQDLLNAE